MADAYVYTGRWTDWKEARFTRATLTTTNSTGGFLLVFAALFVTQAGNSLWKLISYIIHQSRSTDQAQVSSTVLKLSIMHSARQSSLWLRK